MLAQKAAVVGQVGGLGRDRKRCFQLCGSNIVLQIDARDLGRLSDLGACGGVNVCLDDSVFDGI